MAIVKAIHSSPLDLEQPHVTVGSYTHSPLCKCVFQSSTMDFMSTCDIKQEMQRESDEYRHGDTLMCFMCYSKYLLFFILPFLHPSLPPTILLHPPCNLSFNSKSSPSTPLYSSSSSLLPPVLSPTPSSLEFPSSILFSVLLSRQFNTCCVYQGFHDFIKQQLRI